MNFISSFILSKNYPATPCVVMSLNPLSQVGVAFRPRIAIVIPQEKPVKASTAKSRQKSWTPSIRDVGSRRYRTSQTPQGEK